MPDVRLLTPEALELLKVSIARLPRPMRFERRPTGRPGIRTDGYWVAGAYTLSAGGLPAAADQAAAMSQLATLANAAPALLLAADLLPKMAHALEDALGSPDPNERFEALAERFYRETRIMAPGKDVPAASGDDMPYDERRKRWSEWQTARIDGFREVLARYRAALGTAEEAADAP